MLQTWPGYICIAFINGDHNNRTPSGNVLLGFEPLWEVFEYTALETPPLPQIFTLRQHCAKYQVSVFVEGKVLLRRCPPTIDFNVRDHLVPLEVVAVYLLDRLAGDLEAV